MIVILLAITASLPAAASGDANAPAAGFVEKAVPANDPVSWITTADYPTEAIRAGAQGVVGFMLDIGTDGSVMGCAVTVSSGNPGLDAATCDLLRARARFTPAKDAQGHPVASTFSKKVRWFLPTIAEHAAAISMEGTDKYPKEALRNGWEGSTKVGVRVSATGRPDECRVLISSGHKELDDATCYGILKNAKFRAALDTGGRAVPDYVPLTVNWEIPH